MPNLFFYYPSVGGTPSPAKAEVEGGVFIGGNPLILSSREITEVESRLSLDELARKYPYE